MQIRARSLVENADLNKPSRCLSLSCQGRQTKCFVVDWHVPPKGGLHITGGGAGWVHDQEPGCSECESPLLRDLALYPLPHGSKG